MAMTPEELEKEKQAARERMNARNLERDIYNKMGDILLEKGEAGFDDPEYNRLQRQFDKIVRIRNEDIDKRIEAGEI